MVSVSAAGRPYKDNKRLTHYVRGWLWTFLALEVTLTLLDIAKLRAGDVVFSPAYGRTLLGRIEVTVDVLQTVVFTISGLLVLRWIYFACSNLRALGASGLTFTPAWSVGWYFVPIASFWKPYQAMAEIWRASANPFAWESTRPPALLPLWWAMWLAANIAGSASLRLSSTLYGQTAARAAIITDLLASLINVPACLALSYIVTQVNEMQSRESLDEVFGPAPVGNGAS